METKTQDFLGWTQIKDKARFFHVCPLIYLFRVYLFRLPFEFSIFSEQDTLPSVQYFSTTFTLAFLSCAVYLHTLQYMQGNKMEVEKCASLTLDRCKRMQQLQPINNSFDVINDYLLPFGYSFASRKFNICSMTVKYSL